MVTLAPPEFVMIRDCAVLFTATYILETAGTVIVRVVVSVPVKYRNMARASSAVPFRVVSV
jgi:hypothetical protein